MEKYIALYCDNIEKKSLTKNTKEAYLRDVTKFVEYLKDNELEVYDIDNKVIESYVIFLKKNKKANSSIVRSISVIKSFVKFLFLKKVLSEDPRISFEIPKVERKIPQTLTVDEVDILLNAPSAESNKGKRDKAMLELMYACGLKVSELLSLNMFNINLRQEYISCRSGKIERIIPIGSYGIACLRDYFNVRDNMNKNGLALVFFNNKGDKMTRQGFWKMVKEYAQECNIEKNINSYTLRHSFAVHLIQNGANLLAVQRLLGHKNMSTTQIYAEVLKNTELVKVYKDSHPRA